MPKNLTISAACLINKQGEILLVRKRHTGVFMQPGGKPKIGESPLETVIREIQEELGVRFLPEDLTADGQWHGPAANEPDTWISAHLFSGRLDGALEPLSELEELLWIDPKDAMRRNDIAPLLRERVLPTLIEQA